MRDPNSSPEDRLQARLFLLEKKFYVNAEMISNSYENQTMEVPAIDIGKKLERELKTWKQSLQADCLRSVAPVRPAAAASRRR